MMQSRRFDPLLRRAQDHEDAVARELAERQRAHEMQESRLAELRRYACIDGRVVYFARLEFPFRKVRMEFDLLSQR